MWYHTFNFNLSNHKKNEHNVDDIPCEVCEFVGKNIKEYKRHVESNHAEENRNKGKTGKTASPENVKKTKQKTSDHVKIPCDICEYTSKSAEDVIHHSVAIHQQKADNEKPSYKCDRCDYQGAVEAHFKKHFDKLNVGGERIQPELRSKKLCFNWNRGHCSFDTKCRFEHKEILPCMFKERCSRQDCKYWHEAKTGKFPFLDLYQQQFGPNLLPRMEFPSRN